MSYSSAATPALHELAARALGSLCERFQLPFCDPETRQMTLGRPTIFGRPGEHVESVHAHDECLQRMALPALIHALEQRPGAPAAAACLEAFARFD